jgi:hypothetical protein
MVFSNICCMEIKQKVLDKNKQDIYDITYNAFNISANKLGLAFYTKRI